MLELLVKKVADLKACNFIKKRLQHRCFFVNIAILLRRVIFKNICEWLLMANVLWLKKANVLSCWLNTQQLKFIKDLWTRTQSQKPGEMHVMVQPFTCSREIVFFIGGENPKSPKIFLYSQFFYNSCSGFQKIHITR